MFTPKTETPPPLAVLDAEAFRRQLAGLADPDRGATPAEDVEIRDTLKRFCSVLAHLFSEELDRVTLWSRIDSALEAACAKVADGDFERWASLCLDHVKADAARAAACDALGQILGTAAVRTPEWRQAFIRRAAAVRYAVVVAARARWEDVKAGRVDL